VTVRLDALGMRTWTAYLPVLGAPVLDATGDPIRLVFLGGSTTENYPFPDAETFPGLVGSAVAAALGRPVEVRNAGASGATTAVTLGRLQHQVVDLGPDLVVVMHAINDLFAGFAPGYRADQRHLSLPPRLTEQPRSALLDWLRQRRPRADQPPVTSGPSAASIADWTQHPSYGPFVRNLRSIVAVAAAHDVPLLLMTQPTTYATGNDARFRLAARHRAGGAAIPGGESLARGMAVFNDVTRAIAGLAGVPVLDLAMTMPRDDVLYWDECHFTREGNRELARQLAPVVNDRLMAKGLITSRP
jgi:lysophospholipase L1-like esterase